MRGKLGNLARLKHIYDAIIQIEKYIESVNFDDFASNSMMVYAL